MGQAYSTFRDIEACPNWSCVLNLAAAHPADRLDRALPWRLPLATVAGARVSSAYGPRRHPLLADTVRLLHAGLDLAAPVGTPVLASACGRARLGRSPALGLYVMIDHLNGFTSTYAHLSGSVLSPAGALDAQGTAAAAAPPPVAAAQFLQQGECLGWVGATGRATGAHLHFSVHYRGLPLDPLALRRAVLLIR